MAIPNSTYRLQLRQGVTFETAVNLAAYLSDLGADWFYLSPAMTAASGSPHGYDATSFAEIDPQLGGLAGLEALAHRAHALGRKILLDFAPNHMSASIGNDWWRDVLEWGVRSDYAAHFDIDWTAQRLIVPVLGEPYGEALQAGKIGIGFGREGRAVGFAMSYSGVRLPLAPVSYGRVLERVDHPLAQELARGFAASDPGSVAAAKASLAAAVTDAGFLRQVEVAATAVTDDRAALHDLLEEQVWRVSHWRLAREGLTYRRFFEITDLIGVSVERPATFEAAHALLTSLFERTLIDGVRIDHIDGLSDPKGYLDRLRAVIGGNAGPDPYIVVEKILAAEETLRRWPVAGTTGYEFTAAVAQLFVAPAGEAALTEAYEAFAGASPALAAQIRSAKLFILARNLAGELDRLRDLAVRVAEADPATRDFGPDSLRRAILELIAAMPVYRTYVTVAGPSPEDEAVIADAVAAAKATRAVEDEAVVDFLGRLLRLDLPSAQLQAAALQFTLRFQQTSGPVMAKAVEDTVFYRFNRLIALNEVGGDPGRFGGSPEAFHRAMSARLASQPHGLSATATHDTKRGEDSRARLYAISEAPERWARIVRIWRERTGGGAGGSGFARGPERGDAAGFDGNVEWMLLQALLGAWPADLDVADREGIASLRERIEAYLIKALREAKVRTSWASPDAEYEADALAVVRTAFADAAFLRALVAAAQPFFLAGAVNGLAQLALKLAAPGVPDIYQGTELWDLSLVDPDNRRPVDFDLRRRMLPDVLAASPKALVADWRSGRLKMRLLRDGLHLRQRLPELFRDWSYEPLPVSGAREQNVVAFARRHGDRSVVTVAPRLVMGLLEGAMTPLVPPERWTDTAMDLPAGRYRDIVTGAVFEGTASLRDLLSRFPVAILEAASPATTT